MTYLGGYRVRFQAKIWKGEVGRGRLDEGGRKGEGGIKKSHFSLLNFSILGSLIHRKLTNPKFEPAPFR